MSRCLTCDKPISTEAAREHGMCETCRAALGTPEEAARSFEWAARQFGFNPEDKKDKSQ